MRVAVYGIEDFAIGKKIVPDERLDIIKKLMRLNSSKLVYAQMEFVDESRLKDAQMIVCLNSKKDDLILKDLEYIEDRLSREIEEIEKETLLFCQEQLGKESLLNELNLSDEQRKIVNNLPFVTAKPALLIPKEKTSDVASIVKEIFSMAGMISFITCGEKEVRAWPIKKGTTAEEAAGAIHSDMQRGFIKAEVIAYADLISAGGENQAKSMGFMRLEDKTYVVKDGDCMNFRFNV